MVQSMGHELTEPRVLLLLYESNSRPYRSSKLQGYAGYNPSQQTNSRTRRSLSNRCSACSRGSTFRTLIVALPLCITQGPIFFGFLRLHTKTNNTTLPFQRRPLVVVAGLVIFRIVLIIENTTSRRLLKLLCITAILPLQMSANFSFLQQRLDKVFSPS